MTRLCASIEIDDQAAASARIARAEERGADMLELRTDRVAERSDLVEALMARTRLPCIVTCRHAREGGDFKGDDEVRIELLRRLAAGSHPPTYFDVEWSSYRQSPRLREALARLTTPSAATGPGLILSFHDFQGRPSDLLRTVADMSAEPACQVIKIAHLARSIRDCLDLFDLLKNRGKPMIALGMGEFGAPSRLLAGKFGALLTFASVEEQAATAPGQPTIEELLQTYRFRAIGANTAVFGVAGYPLKHSLSPVVHNAAFERIGYDGVYLPLPIAPGYEPFKATIGALIDDSSLHLAGLSVTLPHKEHLLRFARERGFAVGHGAAAVGAANTLAQSAQGWTVSNTDVTALSSLLRQATENESLVNTEVAVIGAGGVARAAAAALLELKARVTIYNRTRERADALADELAGDSATVRGAGLAELRQAAPSVIVNATSLGMRGGPDPDALVVPSQLLRPGVLVLDTVYNPLETPLLADARRAGCRTIDGLSMFLAQAAGQCETWTGESAPLQLMRERALERLSSL